MTERVQGVYADPILSRIEKVWILILLAFRVCV